MTRIHVTSSSSIFSYVYKQLNAFINNEEMNGLFPYQFETIATTAQTTNDNITIFQPITRNPTGEKEIKYQISTGSIPSPLTFKNLAKNTPNYHKNNNSNIYKDIQGLIIIFDSSNIQTYNDAIYFLQKIDKLNNFPMFIYKCSFASRPNDYEIQFKVSHYNHSKSYPGKVVLFEPFYHFSYLIDQIILHFSNINNNNNHNNHNNNDDFDDAFIS